MAKNAFEIHMDYDRAIRQANLLERTANEMRQSAENELQDCMSEVSYNWTGENADAYLAKCNQLKTSIVNTAHKLDNTADTIRKIARNTYNAEMRALELARTRKY